MKQAIRRFSGMAVIGLAAVSLSSLRHLPSAQAEPSSSEMMRQYYLDALIYPETYAPGKNSFLIQNLHRGEKRTVLKLNGSGSVRHIWSTWSAPGDDSDIPPAGRVRLHVFVDSQPQPVISGALDDLCRAAGKNGNRFVPLPAFNYQGAFNFYLPIYFERNIRMEIEATGDLAEFYTQIDYRTGDRHQSPMRLVSDGDGAGTILRYLGGTVPWQPREVKTDDVRKAAILEFGPQEPAEITIDGPGIMRDLSFSGGTLWDLQLEIYWDDEPTPSVEAPLQYFFADFNNAAMESSPGKSTTYFPMPFRKNARLAVHSLSGRSGQVKIEYSTTSGPLPAGVLYFHARYNETAGTTGYSQYQVLEAEGEGLFVGMNLFDSGHNHGGGDAALLDAGTAHPRVLHGICGEDYFGFAWHHTGAMTPLTGAPAHARRYRLHLENPYPFRESIQVLFGVFAGQHPKSVAFWYQLPAPATRTAWHKFDVPWKILGPLGLDTALREAVSDTSYETVISLNHPTKLEERWRDVEMRSGFLDASYQFRHYTMIEKGTGFVAGTGKTEIVTYLYVPSRRKLRALLGHDDQATVTVNGVETASLPAQRGFHPSRLSMSLNAGWNQLVIIIYNDENVNWRWSGVSLSFQAGNDMGLKFASTVPRGQEQHPGGTAAVTPPAA